MPERAANLRAELILKAMIAVATADGGLEDREVSLIQQVYEDQAERPITRDEIVEVLQASTRDEPVGRALRRFSRRSTGRRRRRSSAPPILRSLPTTASPARNARS